MYSCAVWQLWLNEYVMLCYVVCCFVNKHTKHKNYHLVTGRLSFIHKTINYAPNMTNTVHKASSHLICTQSSFTMSAIMSGAIRHVSYESFFRLTADTISEIFYYSVSTNVNYYQTRCWRQFCFQQDSTLAHHACNTVKLQGRELSTSLLLIMAFNLTAQQWNYWLWDLEIHTLARV